jgi:hypothetical protein
MIQERRLKSLERIFQINMTLIHLADSGFWNTINDQHQITGGIYKIIAIQNGQRIPVNRFLGTDNSGILYIGKATSFVDRVINLKKSISPDHKGSSHICGRRYKSNPNIAKKFPYDILYIELIPGDNPQELERNLLAEYVTTFGEVPPLNAI